MDHPKTHLTHGTSSYNWLPAFVYGASDGVVTTFAVVAGVEGANLSIAIIFILGMANLFADGFSMAVGKYLSDKAEEGQYRKIEAIEFQHLKERKKRETAEVRTILKEYGFTGQDLQRATKVITSNPRGWVDLMMRKEFNLTLENVKPLWGGFITFLAFIIVGSIPLFGYLLGPIFDFSEDQTFWFTSATTLGALFLIGTIKARFTAQNWLLTGLQTLVVGGVAAAIAYFIGVSLQGMLVG